MFTYACLMPVIWVVTKSCRRKVTDIGGFDFLCTCRCMWDAKGSLYLGFYSKCQSLDNVIVAIFCRVSKFLYDDYIY